ncbi:MAG: hypothetical protein ACKOC6_08540, partial [bacterium]
MTPRLAPLALSLLLATGTARAGVDDHLPPLGRPAPAAVRATNDTTSRVFVSLISGRDEAGRDLNLM